MAAILVYLVGRQVDNNIEQDQEIDNLDVGIGPCSFRRMGARTENRRLWTVLGGDPYCDSDSV